MRKHLSTILLVLILMTGLSLLLYPTVSDAWNALHQTRAIDSYTANVARINDARYKEILQQAEDYNAHLFATPHALALTESQIPDYESQLNVAGDGIMGYIEIPRSIAHCPSTMAPGLLSCRLPSGILTVRLCRWAAPAPIRFYPVTAAFPVPDCSPVWTSWRRVTALCCMCWMKR